MCGLYLSDILYIAWSAVLTLGPWPLSWALGPSSSDSQRYPPPPRPRGAMALSKLSGDEQCIIFSQLCNVLDPGVAVAFGMH